MHQRYFLIEPKYSDPDAFCHFVVGSDRVHASVQIYADIAMLEGVASALVAPSLDAETPVSLEAFKESDPLFDFFLTVLPHEGKDKCLRFRVFQEYLDDGAPYRADIRFELTSDEAAEFATELKAWCANPTYVFNWKGH